MKASSLFVTHFAVAALWIVPLCGSSGAAWSQTATSQAHATRPLPGIQVDAPGAQRAKHQRLMQHAVASNAASPRMWPSGSSMRSGDRPWIGCSSSAGAYAYTGCRNIGPGGVPFKTYNECTENALKYGWRTTEGYWYCSTLALKE